MGVGASTPICPFNLAEAMGLDIRFVKIASFEGMYLADSGVVLISAERPEGRKNFTCAHELGHHILGHGTVIDEIIESGSDKEIELEADFFASMILMPASAVLRAIKDIAIDIDNVLPEQIYILSKYMGVSFRAMITQLHFNLRLISWSKYSQLKKESLPQIKNNLLHGRTKAEVIVVGDWWTERAVDAVEGDFVVCDKGTEVEGLALNLLSNNDQKNIYQAIMPGIAKITNREDWSVFVRVSKPNYVGMYQFRHEEEIE